MQYFRKAEGARISNMTFSTWRQGKSKSPKPSKPIHIKITYFLIVFKNNFAGLYQSWLSSLVNGHLASSSFHSREASIYPDHFSILFGVLIRIPITWDSGLQDLNSTQIWEFLIGRLGITPHVVWLGLLQSSETCICSNWLILSNLSYCCSESQYIGKNL